MTAPNPAELARLDAAATPGEWVAAVDSIIEMPGDRFGASTEKYVDAALIVYLRNHTADFLAAMEERDRLAAALRNLLSYTRGVDHDLDCGYERLPRGYHDCTCPGRDVRIAAHAALEAK